MAEKNNANIGFEKQIWDAAFIVIKPEMKRASLGQYI